MINHIGINTWYLFGAEHFYHPAIGVLERPGNRRKITSANSGVAVLIALPSVDFPPLDDDVSDSAGCDGRRAMPRCDE